MGYTKLFSEIILSTVWREPNHVRIVWITMLALKDRWHLVNASIPGLADAAKVSVEECTEALRILSSPDQYSRSTDFEGRRIEQCEGGWIVLNGEKYRNKMSLDERREYQRIKQIEYRRRKRVKSCQQNGQRFTHTDTDTEADTDITTNTFAPSSARLNIRHDAGVGQQVPQGGAESITPTVANTRGRKKPVTSVPDDFTPAGDLVAWAQSLGLGRDVVDRETPRFLDYHRGKGSRFADWNAAWRNWMRNAKEWSRDKKAAAPSMFEGGL